MSDKVVLLIEDNAGDEALTLRALTRHGIANTVHVARDGAEGLDYLFQTGAHAGSNAVGLPAVVLLDLNLPKIGGHEVLKRIRADERTKLLPVVVLTSSDEERDYLESYQSGANSYVKKPVEFSEFAEAVRQLGLYWLLLNEPPPEAKPGEPLGRGG